jgi:hypothetical protein
LQAAVASVRGRRWFLKQSDASAAYAAEVAARRPHRLRGLPSVLGPHAPPMWGASGADWGPDEDDDEGEKSEKVRACPYPRAWGKLVHVSRSDIRLISTF